MIPTPDLDFLAEHGRTHVVRNGNRAFQDGDLSRTDEPLLVAGTATLGGKRLVGEIPGSKGLRELSPPTSPDGRFLALRRGEMIELYDTEDGCRRWFCFQPPAGWEPDHPAVVHPSGEMMAFAVGRSLKVTLPDEGELSSATLGSQLRRVEVMGFSGSGDYLWTVCEGQRPAEASLQLRHGRTLELLDETEVPFGFPEETYDDQGARQTELLFQMAAANDTLMLCRSAGYSYLTIVAYTVWEGNIHTHVVEPPPDQADRFAREPVRAVTMARDGTRFWTLTRYGQLCEWSWPECRVLADTHEYELLNVWGSWNPADQSHRVGLELEGVLVERDGILYAPTREGTVLLGRTGTLRPIVHPIDLLWGELLPNGRVLMRLMGWKREVSEMVVTDDRLPAVIGFAAGSAEIEHVYHRRDGEWADIPGQTAWVEPFHRFRQA